MSSNRAPKSGFAAEAQRKVSFLISRIPCWLLEPYTIDLIRNQEERENQNQETKNQFRWNSLA